MILNTEQSYCLKVLFNNTYLCFLPVRFLNSNMIAEIPHSGLWGMKQLKELLIFFLLNYNRLFIAEFC